MGKDKKLKDKNILYIGIITVIIVAIIIVVVVAHSKSKKDNSESTSVASIEVLETKGSQDETINADIKNIRNVKLGAKKKAVNAYEKKQSGTKKGTYTVSTDGKVSYYTFKFEENNPIEFFGVKVVPTDKNALLQYLFNANKELYEVRVQCGNLSKESYDSLVSNITGTYGEPTFSRLFSNGSAEHWWKTNKVTLMAYYQSTGVSVYFTKN